MERFYRIIWLRMVKKVKKVKKGLLFVTHLHPSLPLFSELRSRAPKEATPLYPSLPLLTPLNLSLPLLTLFFLPSCDVGDYIGDIFGRWQITSIQTPDSIATPTDLFYDFQSKVHVAHVLYEEEHRTLDLHGLARQEGDSLFIKYLPMDSTGNTMREFISKRFLIEDDYADVRFHILRIDGSRMILERGNRRWELRAY